MPPANPSSSEPAALSPRSIFASTACLGRSFPNLVDQVDGYVANGISNVELGFCGDKNAQRSIDLLPGRAKNYLIHNYFPPPAAEFVLNLASNNAGLRERCLDFCVNAISLTRRLGGSFYSVHAGFRADFTAASLGKALEFAGVATYEEAYQHFTRSLRHLLSHCESQGVSLLIEPNVVAPFNLREGRNDLLMFAEPAEFQRLFEDVPHPRLGLLIDTGHLNVTAKTLAFRREDFTGKLAARVGAFHAHDNDGNSDQHRPLETGSWAIDVLKAPPFADLPVIIEAQFNSIPALADHYKWLEQQLAITQG